MTGSVLTITHLLAHTLSFKLLALANALTHILTLSMSILAISVLIFSAVSILASSQL